MIHNMIFNCFLLYCYEKPNKIRTWRTLNIYNDFYSAARLRSILLNSKYYQTVRLPFTVCFLSNILLTLSRLL